MLAPMETWTDSKPEALRVWRHHIQINILMGKVHWGKLLALGFDRFHVLARFDDAGSASFSKRSRA